MQFILVTAHFSNNDAVCNDAVLIGEYLEKQSHDVSFFAPTADATFRKKLLTKEQFQGLAKNRETIVIYEHCIFMPSFDDLFRGSQCQIWLRYQNITPPRFYAPYDPAATHATTKGLAQAKDLVKDPRVTLFVPGSEFTADDLRAWGAEPSKIKVIAPISRTDDFAGCKIDPVIKRALTDKPETTNLLFVGRVVPNKGHHHLIEVLKSYISLYGPTAHLWIVGGLIAQFGKYYRELEQLVNRHQLGDHVTFTGSITFDGLHTFYKYSDVFLLMSEHEGFCVPITEAQYHGLPIVAVDQGPFKDAVGPDQMMIDKYDYSFLASACAKIKKEPELAEQLAAAGTKHLKLHSPAALNEKIQTVVDHYTSQV